MRFYHYEVTLNLHFVVYLVTEILYRKHKL
jgi:hypothetical protein